MIKKTGGMINYSKRHKLFSLGTGSKQKSINKTWLYSSCVIFSLLFFLRFSPQYLLTPLCCTLLPFCKHFFSLSPQLACSQMDFQDTCHIIPLFCLIFIMKLRLLGVFVLFKLIYIHLLWKRLGREPLINAEVASSVILILSKCFPRSTWWWWHLK